MEEKKRGGARIGAGRKSQGKTNSRFGYKYTPEELQEIETSLSMYAEKMKCTKSRALYDLLTAPKRMKNYILEVQNAIYDDLESSN